MDVRALRRLLTSGRRSRSSRRDPGHEPGASAATSRPAEGRESLDVALLSYRSDPYSGGQGVYVNYLSRALVEQGHSVDVISGRPYPDLDPRVRLVELPGENVVDEVDRLRAFEPGYLRDPTKLFEWASVLTGGFPDPYAFGRRVVDYFEANDPSYDVVHDNQSLCYGLLDLAAMGVPVVATVHHPITVDRDLALADADDLTGRLLVRRWYRFLRMQRRVVSRLPHVVAVSDAARRRTITDFGADPDAVTVVHNGVDAETFAPRDDDRAHAPAADRAVADGGHAGGTDRPRHDGRSDGTDDDICAGTVDGAEPLRVMTTVSADTPLKGARYLLEAFAAVRDRRRDDDRNVELVVVGEFDEGGTAAELAADLGVADAIATHSGISTEVLVELYGTADVAAVPSLYEGFGLPAGEAMACGVPVVATTGGALPEVVGECGVLVPPGDADALADAIAALLEDPDRRARLGARGRKRVRAEFDWDETARETLREYRRAIAHADG